MTEGWIFIIKIGAVLAIMLGVTTLLALAWNGW